MIPRCAVSLTILLCVVGTCNALWEFSTTYDHDGKEWDITGLEPENSESNLPVFIYLAGTADTQGARSSTEFVEAMARRGFISAEVDYPNHRSEYEWDVIKEMFGDGGMDDFLERAKDKAAHIFPAALDVLCAKERADCSAGVAVSGFDQGGYMTLFSIQFDDRITAIMPLGVECLKKDPLIPLADLGDVFLSQFVPSSNRLIINGETEENPLCLSKMSGVDDCPTNQNDCRRVDGSGFIFVPEAGHNFFANCHPSKKSTEMKCAYIESTEPWALFAATDWLARTAAPDDAVVPAEGEQLCDSTSGDTAIDTAKDCGRWVVIPIFFTFLGLAIICCCCVPCCVAFFLWRRKQPPKPVPQQPPVARTWHKPIYTVPTQYFGENIFPPAPIRKELPYQDLGTIWQDEPVAVYPQGQEPMSYNTQPAFQNQLMHMEPTTVFQNPAHNVYPDQGIQYQGPVYADQGYEERGYGGAYPGWGQGHVVGNQGFG